MKYNLIGKNNLLSIKETVLRNRGIDDIELFENPSPKSVIHWSKLKNIKKAIDCLIKRIQGGDKLFVQVDSDP